MNPLATGCIADFRPTSYIAENRWEAELRRLQIANPDGHRRI